MNSGRPRQIRQLVQSQFAELRPDCQQIEQETLLIRDGQYCGHRYQGGGLTAVWFLEENQLKFYDTDGGVLQVVKPPITISECDERGAPERRSDAA